MTPVPYNKILLALDGSEQSLETARYLSRMMPAHTQEVLLFHVRDKIPDSYWELEKDPQFGPQVKVIQAWDAREREKIEEFFNQVREMFLAAGYPEGMIKVRIADKVQGVARDIVAESGKGYAVVVGRIGSSRARLIKDLVLGGTAYKILSRVTDTDLCLVSGSPQPGNILWALNSPEGALRAAGLVTNLLRGQARDLVLFHADRGRTVSDQAVKLLDEVKTRLIGTGFGESRIRTVTAAGVGSVSAAIVETAVAEGCGTVTISRRSQTVPGELLVGRVTNRVVHLAYDLAVWVSS
ncbi:MAG: universal stress protein [Thermodesulfobacteriota bacterium]